MKQALVALGCGAATAILGIWGDRTQFPLFLFFVAIAFGTYTLLVYMRPSWTWVFWTGMVVRLILLFIPPHLSEDVYRFLWDGYLIHQGVHPFSDLPSQYIQAHGSDQVLVALYERLNSPGYYTVYPPVSQLVYYIGAAALPWGISWGIVVIKSVLILCELALLRLWRRDKRISMLYWLNPLVVIEIAGNVHFEGMMLLGVAWSIHWIKQGRILASAGAISAAVAVKLLPVLWVPILWAELPASKRKRWLAYVATFSAVLFAPVLLAQGIAMHMMGSVGLYFQKFEFNASLYYAFVHLSPFLSGWYQGADVTRLLAVSTIVVVIVLTAIRLRQPGYSFAVADSLLLATTVYLLGSAAVHPWYILTPLILGIMSGRKYPIVWSGLVFLSYSHYHQNAFSEQPLWIWTEYILLFFSIWLSVFYTKHRQVFAFF